VCCDVFGIFLYLTCCFSVQWAENAFNNLRVIPPGTGSGGLHQMNVEATARVVCHESETAMLYPDSVMGTDTHTSVSNAMGIFSIGGQQFFFLH